MQRVFKKTALTMAVGLALTLGACGGGDDAPVVPDQLVASIQAVPAIKALPFDFDNLPATCPTTSHPFSTMLCTWGESFVENGTKPVDIKQYGYTEKEFLQSGKANVYDLGADDRAVVRSSGNPYTTRLLVRFPTDPKKFSGRVYIDILNASSGVDLEDIWRRSWKHMMLSGDAYIGITSKSLTANALKKFDAERYKDINWKVNGVDENGLFWDMLSQLGTVLRQKGTGGILGSLQPQYVYVGGQSQSGGYMNTYITAFSDRLEKAGPGGKPLFDGYLSLVGPFLMPLRSEAPGKVPSVSVPKTLYKATSVPQIVMMSEGESRFYNALGNGVPDLFPAIPQYSRRADSNSATDKFRFYEVVGAPHADPTSPIIPINSEISKAKADGTARAPKVYIAGHEEGALHIDDFVSGALENLHAWASKGIPAPAADSNWMWYSVTKDAKGNNLYDPLRDQLGNALGGVRSPLIEAPLYQYFGQGNGTALDWGSASRLSDATINALYSGSCTNYLARYNAATDAMVTGRYIVQRDGEALKALGKKLATTGNVTTTVNYAPVAWTSTPCN